jgi:hypothetical protein
MAEASAARLPLTVSAAKINRAVRLYERLDFTTTYSEEFKIYMMFCGDKSSKR